MSKLAQRLRKNKKGLFPSPFKVRPQVNPENVIEMLPRIAKEIVSARMVILEQTIKKAIADAEIDIKDFVTESRNTTRLVIADHIRTRSVEIRGEKGEPGYTPVKGKDYSDGKTPVKGIDYDDGITPTTETLLTLIEQLIPPAKEGSPDTPEEVVEKVNASEKLIAISKIAGLEEWIKRVSESRRGKFGGGGSGGGITILTATGTIDDSNTTFTFPSSPKIVSVNGTFYVDGSGVTITGTTAVLDNAAGVGGSVYGMN